jgi:UDPglucose--hexose-1-phosphate uridylyltransferase
LSITISVQMNEPDLRVDPLTGAYVVVTPWRQRRPRLPEGQCPFCPGGIEAPEHYDVRHIPNRWPGLPEGRHEVIIHNPEHGSSFPLMGREGAVRVVELWSERTAVLGARSDVSYVFIFENRGRLAGATIDHPHSQVMAFRVIPPVPGAELSKGICGLCGESDDELMVARHPEWLASVPWAPSWPYEILIFPRRHIVDLPAAGPQLRAALAGILVDCLMRVESIFGVDAPYMLWIHQQPTDGDHWPAGHLHLHLAPVMGRPGVVRNLSSAELGAGMLFNPVDPRQAAAELRKASGADRLQGDSAAVNGVSVRDDNPNLAR